jgi:Lon protease-like protein
MVRDALAGERLIGMALLKGEWEKDYYGNPEIFPVGCVGKIVGHTPLPDGRCNILLYGMAEYQIGREIVDRSSYRQAQVVLRDEPKPMEAGPLDHSRAEILTLLREIIDPDSPLLKVLEDGSIDGATWINVCCFWLNVDPMEKQTLLEAQSLEERAGRLIEVLRFVTAEKNAAFDPRERKLPQ